MLQTSKKFELKQEGCVLELHVHDLEPEDSGYYTCDAGDQLTTASITVQGIKNIFKTFANCILVFTNFCHRSNRHNCLKRPGVD